MIVDSSENHPAGSPANPIPLPKDKKLLQEYYEGRRLPSPLGGQLDLLGVRAREDGIGQVLFECNVSSLRYVLTIPKATRTEKSKVKKAAESGEDPPCPRHGSRQILNKSVKGWFCSQCGVTYGRVA